MNFKIPVNLNSIMRLLGCKNCLILSSTLT